MAESFKFYQDKAAEARRRIAELKKAFLSFSIPNDDFVFIVDPAYRGYLLPFFEEVKKLEVYNASVLQAIQESRGIYGQLHEDGLIYAEKNPEETHPVLRDTIGSLQMQIGNAKSRLEDLKIIDKESLETIIPPENRKRADELKKLITFELPDQIKRLQQGYQKAESLFDNLDIVIPAAGENIPKLVTE